MGSMAKVQATSTEDFPGRADFHAIAQWIQPGARVLDLGCGDGSLLRFLKEKRDASGYGIEIDDTKLLASVAKRVNVLQSDLESGLSGFESGSFDYVILSQTLQAVRHTEQIIREMLRVGREGIVTFPNFGYLAAPLAGLGRAHAGVTRTAVSVVQHAQRPSAHHRGLRGILCRARRADFGARGHGSRRNGVVSAEFAGLARRVPLR